MPIKIPLGVVGTVATVAMGMIGGLATADYVTMNERRDRRAKLPTTVRAPQLV